MEEDVEFMFLPLLDVRSNYSHQSHLIRILLTNVLSFFLFFFYRMIKTRLVFRKEVREEEENGQYKD